MKNPAIARSARRLRLLVWAGAGLIVAIWLLAKFGPQVGPVRVETHTAALGAAGRAIVDLTLLLFVVALARLAQMLGAIESGPLFGPHVTRAFRGFAFWLFLATLFDVADARRRAVPVSAGAQAGAGEDDRGRAGGNRLMAIIVRLDVMLALRKVRSKDLAEAIGITEANLSLLKSGKVKGVRFATLDAICEQLQCQPGDLLEHIPGEGSG